MTTTLLFHLYANSFISKIVLDFYFYFYIIIFLLFILFTLLLSLFAWILFIFWYSFNLIFFHILFFNWFCYTCFLIIVWFLICVLSLSNNLSCWRTVQNSLSGTALSNSLTMVAEIKWPNHLGTDLLFYDIYQKSLISTALFLSHLFLCQFCSQFCIKFYS